MRRPYHPAEPALEVALRYAVGEFQLEADFVLPHGLGVLFGPSGAGKTLTLQLVAGLLSPSAGRVRIADKAVVDTEAGTFVVPQARRVGMVFQDAVLLPHRSALDNVALAVRGGRRRQRRAAAAGWLDRVGVAELADRRPGTLSGGQRQRVALARALAGRPRLLLLDEPFNALDLAVRRQLRGLVRELVHDQGLPALFVTHDPGEAAELADVLVLARHGSVTQTFEVDDAAQLLTHLSAAAQPLK